MPFGNESISIRKKKLGRELWQSTLLRMRGKNKIEKYIWGSLSYSLLAFLEVYKEDPLRRKAKPACVRRGMQIDPAHLLQRVFYKRAALLNLAGATTWGGNKQCLKMLNYAKNVGKLRHHGRSLRGSCLNADDCGQRAQLVKRNIS